MANFAARALLAAALALPTMVVADDHGSMDQVIADLQSTALKDGLSWELLESLTTDVGPRMPGTAGDALGVAWAEARMKALGFDRVWLEPVSFPFWRRGDERASVIAPREQSMAVAAIGRSPGTNGPIRAEVVSFADLDALEAIPDGSLEGKIAFLTTQMKPTQAGSDYSRVVRGRSLGPYAAARKGASALIIRSVGTSTNRLPHTGNMSGTAEGEPVPSAAISNPDADLLESLLSRNESVTFELDLDVGFDGTAESFNVIGEFDGRESTGEFVLIGAHLDSWDLGTGAHDDGAGVAITMAAAKLVSDLPQRPRRGVRVVLFANEEQGIFGGKAYAAAHADEVAAHAVGAESDLGAGRIYQFRSRVNEAAEPALEQLATYLAPLGIPRTTDRPAFGGADISQISRLGVPVIDLNHDASKYFDLHHTANDVLANVNEDDMAFNVAAYVTFVYFSAETEADFGPIPAW